MLFLWAFQGSYRKRVFSIPNPHFAAIRQDLRQWARGIGLGWHLGRVVFADLRGGAGQGTELQVLWLALVDVFAEVALLGGVVEDLLVRAREVDLRPVVARIEEVVAEAGRVESVGHVHATEEFERSVRLVAGEIGVGAEADFLAVVAPVLIRIEHQVTYRFSSKSSYKLTETPEFGL